MGLLLAVSAKAVPVEYLGVKALLDRVREKRTEEQFDTTQGSNEPNLGCGTFYRAGGPVSSKE